MGVIGSRLEPVNLLSREHLEVVSLLVFGKEKQEGERDHIRATNQEGEEIGREMKGTRKNAHSHARVQP